MTQISAAADIAAHPLSQRGNDLYQTPDSAVKALLACENLPHRIWEPACGPGAIVGVLQKAGYVVFASDIVDYGLPGAQVQDFLAFDAAPEGYGCIVTNPPFSLDEEFIAQGLRLVPKMCLLLRLSFLEGYRWPNGLQRHLRTVHILVPRPPMMHREGWTGPKIKSGRFPMAWFVFGSPWHQPPQINWVNWREYV